MAQNTLQSDVTGTVWKIEVSAGQSVGAEQTLLILESMKMEIPVSSPEAATVLRILVKEGEAVAEGQDLIVID
jgi:acetyl-CoA carboxylase biotin carboxyl carrier protein